MAGDAGRENRAGRWRPGTTDGLDEGSYHLYFTKKRAQNAVGSILEDTRDVDLRYEGRAVTAVLTTRIHDLLDFLVAAAPTARATGSGQYRTTADGGYRVVA